jgi:hypothetical protein
MSIVIDGTNGITSASWTTSNRPASPTTGQMGYNTTTGELDVWNGSAWASIPMTTSQGTSGQILQSAGAGAIPAFSLLGLSSLSATGTASSTTYLRGDNSWATVTIPNSGSGVLIRTPRVLVSGSGTSYTTPSNCNYVYVEVVGGGGGGGGQNASGACGGGGGGYAAKYFTVSPSTAYTYAVGGGGSTATNGTGGTGGSSTFSNGSITITGSGGTGGAAPNIGTGGAGGTGTNGDINISGQQGGWGDYLSTGGVGIATIVGSGGSSFLGMGAPGSHSGSSYSTFIAITGTAGGLYGGGGSGGSGGNSSGAGAAGVVRIWEYT